MRDPSVAAVPAPRVRRFPVLEADLGDGRSLRQLDDGDAEELFELIDANRAHLANWMPFVSQTHASPTRSRSSAPRAARPRRTAACSSRSSASGRIIGVAGFHGIDWTRRSTSIGYWLAAAHQGAGTMTSAVAAMLDHAFGPWDLARVEIRAGVANRRSRAIPERLGFREEGVLRAAERIGTRVIDHVVYVMTAARVAARAAPPSRG